MNLSQLHNLVEDLIAKHGGDSPCASCILLPDDVTSNGDREDLSPEAIEGALLHMADSPSLRGYAHDLIDDHLRFTGYGV